MEGAKEQLQPFPLGGELNGVYKQMTEAIIQRTDVVINIEIDKVPIKIYVKNHPWYDVSTYVGIKVKGIASDYRVYRQAIEDARYQFEYVMQIVDVIIKGWRKEVFNNVDTILATKTDI